MASWSHGCMANCLNDNIATWSKGQMANNQMANNQMARCSHGHKFTWAHGHHSCSPMMSTCTQSINPYVAAIKFKISYSYSSWHHQTAPGHTSSRCHGLPKTINMWYLQCHVLGHQCSSRWHIWFRKAWQYELQSTKTTTISVKS